jgi:hypothetical protein
MVLAVRMVRLDLLRLVGHLLQVVDKELQEHLLALELMVRVDVLVQEEHLVLAVLVDLLVEEELVELVARLVHQEVLHHQVHLQVVVQVARRLHLVRQD